VTGVVLGIDQGTSSTRCLALDERMEVLGVASVPVSCSFPGAGRVEQDPGELAASARSAAAAALQAAGVDARAVVAAGIANQTETFVVCERDSGRPVHPAIVWQDRRTAARCDELAAAGHSELVRARTGLELDPTFSATKVAWVLDHVGGARQLAAAGELAFHDVAGWLVRSLAGKRLCDVGNAGRTLLCGLGSGDWDDELLALFDVPRALMPPIVDSDGIDCAVADGSPLSGIPLAAALGDQQASLLGVGCRTRGQAKVTLGTGAFLLVQAGEKPVLPPDGVLASCAWRIHGRASYALEGFIPAAGSAIDWFASIGLLPRASDLDTLLLAAGPEDGSVACVPALQGLGTPSWDPGVRAAMIGMSRATTRAQLARAVVDGVLHQVADALAAIATQMPLSSLVVDGGMARSDWVLQRLADLTGVEVGRAAHAEGTAIGAAIAAGLAVGAWQERDLREAQTDRIMQPGMPEARRGLLREQWATAVEVARRWR
jgi:glycerol kinase